MATFYADDNSFAKVSYGPKLKGFVIDYFDDKGYHFYNEEYKHKSLREVEELAEEWATGYRQLENM